MSDAIPHAHDLARYQEALRQARHEVRERLTSADLSAILDALNGHWFTDANSVSYTAVEVEDAVRLNALDEKWHINGPSLVSLLTNLSYIESCALADAAERFWARVGAGEHDLNPADALDDPEEDRP